MLGIIAAPTPSVFAPPAQQGGAGLLSNPNDLTPEQKKQVDELKARDREVRQHEQAHKTVGGPYAGAVSYETVTGPDGRDYAVAGEVQIDVSPVSNNPEATMRKMEIVERAALAPAEPSPQDRAVAAQARAIKIQAQSEMQEENGNETSGLAEPRGLLSEMKEATKAYTDALMRGEDPDAAQNEAKTEARFRVDSITTFFTAPPTVLFA